MKYILYILLTLELLNADILKENYISFDLNNSTPKVTLDFESDNLEQYIELDTNKNGLISWGELKDKKSEIIKFVLPHLNIEIDGYKCKNISKNFEVHRRVHQSYIKLDIDLLSCNKPESSIKINYNLFFDVDRNQKAFINIADKNNSNPMILSYRQQELTVKIKKSSAWNSFVNFLEEGIWHIWMGIDHILFLLMLLIPSVIYYEQNKIVAESSLKKSFIKILKIVTAFTLAHSITLALSVLNIVEINPQFIEVSIALSVLITALNNLFRFIKIKSWMLAFGFGLIHGFGFANALKEMALKSSELAISLVGFNLGVEIGQLVIVSLVTPILFFTKKTKFYKYIILYGFSFITAIISILWAYERYRGISILYTSH